MHLLALRHYLDTEDGKPHSLPGMPQPVLEQTKEEKDMTHAEEDWMTYAKMEVEREKINNTHIKPAILSGYVYLTLTLVLLFSYPASWMHTSIPLWVRLLVCGGWSILLLANCYVQYRIYRTGYFGVIYRAYQRHVELSEAMDKIVEKYKTPTEANK